MFISIIFYCLFHTLQILKFFGKRGWFWLMRGTTLVWLGILFASPTFAQTVVFTDDFSQGLEKWQAVRDDGSRWQVVDGKAEATVRGLSTITELVPKDNHWDSSWRNIEYELDFTPLEGVDRNISFGWQDVQNWYEVHFVTDMYNILRFKDGLPTLNLLMPYRLENGRTYHIKILQNQAHIAVWIDGALIANTTDWSFNSNVGRIGIKVGTGAAAPSRAQFDNIVVRTLPPEVGKQLNVPLLKQTDPQWANDEYDTARQWAETGHTTIRNWGCAMTSVAMIMQHYGMLALPDGQPLNPKTINAWLASQTDGYLGQGGVNWVALTRLTRQIHDKFGTPKLEYQRFGAGFALMSLTKQEIQDHDRPVILEIPGHFLVADGITADFNDLYIKDPAYKFIQFSQHHTTPLSLRQFVPSNTDLSYLLIVASQNLDVKFTFADGGIFSLQASTEPADVIQDRENPSAKTPLLKVLSYAKPPSAQFTLSVRRTGPGPTFLQGFAYDQSAEYTAFPFPTVINDTELRFTLDYHKTGGSSFHQQLSFAQLSQDIIAAHQRGEWRDEPLFTKVMVILKYAQTAGFARQQRYSQLLRMLMNGSNKKVTPETWSTLKQELADVIATLQLGG